MDIIKRPRRLRINENMRRLVRETYLSVDDFIYPIFIVEGTGIKSEIPSMPGVYHFSLDLLEKELEEIAGLNIPGVLLFGLPDRKDEIGSQAYDDSGIVQRAVRLCKKSFPELLVASDVCLCEYTSHGHCGLVSDGKIKNDSTVEILTKVALSHANAGADIIAPSDMMDGRVGAIRNILNANGFSYRTIMSYSAKYSSAFYGPFREAAHSAPSFGNRKSYQMDYSNVREALKEVELDIEEGADIIMVKPALSYLDIIKTVSENINVPVAAYNVSGEYSMIKAAAQNGWIDERSAAMETLTSIKRAGAKIIITYFAKDAAAWLKGGNK